MSDNGYFDMNRDNELIASGTHFWCHGHLAAQPVDDISLDNRYCQSCYDFLLREWEIIKGWGNQRKPYWLPVKSKSSHLKSERVSKDVYLNMATVNDKKSEVAIIHSPTFEVANNRRGPKHRDLPLDIIEKWQGEGLGSKRIASRLKEEYGVEVGFRTIARILSGQRTIGQSNG